MGISLTDVRSTLCGSVLFVCTSVASQTFRAVSNQTSFHFSTFAVALDLSKASSQPSLHFWTICKVSFSPVALILWYAFFLLDNDLLEDKAHLFSKVVFVVLTSTVSGM